MKILKVANKFSKHNSNFYYLFMQCWYFAICFQPAVRTQVSDLVSSVRNLYNETQILLSNRDLAIVSKKLQILNLTEKGIHLYYTLQTKAALYVQWQ